MTQHDDAWFALQSELAGVYSLERELGRGGMGTVHLAREVSLDRPVAIKVLHPELAARPDQRARFVAEARTAAQLAHPNIVPIYAVGESDSVTYFVMGFVDGESLRARLYRDGPLAPDAAMRVLREIGQALALAHAHGFVHRDITLDNILIERSTGRAILLDFGIAGEIESDSVTPLIGTPAYLAPELIQGAVPSRQSDIYALGVAGWAMLTGRLPFADQDTSRVLIQQLTAPVPSLTTAAAGTPDRLRRAIEQSLSKEPAHRPRDVEQWLADMADAAAAPPLATPLQHWLRRGQGTRLLYGLAMSVAAIRGAIYFSFSWGTGWWSGVLGLFQEFLTIVPLIVLVHVALEIRGLRLVARAGYRIEDLQLAVDRQETERRRHPMRLPSLLARMVRNVTVLALLVWLMVQIGAVPWSRSMPHGRYGYFVVREVWDMFEHAIRYSYLVFWSGLAFCTITPELNQHPGVFARIGQRFWHSRTARWALRVAGIGADPAAATTHTLHRPTELVLDLAIEDLWTSLPAGARDELKAIPKVAASLREQVAEMKELARQLDTPALASQPDVVQLRERVVGRQDETIGALERLRLRLGALHGAAAPTGPLTEQLRGARKLESELLRDLGAHPSVDRLLRQAGRRSTPDVTPQTA